VLAGMAGSLLFWIWVIITPWLYEELKSIKKNVNEDLKDWTRIISFSVLVILLFVLILYDLFKPTAINLLNLYPNGQGLSPLLQTELMVIHPPIVFIGYGLIALVFASTLAYLITGHKEWITFSLNWSRLGWLFLTLGIGLGALWAYVVLGWGGYWGWDPVETSSLVPWIILTGFLHIQLMYKRKKDYSILAPVLGILSFVLVIFATFVTRAGGLWVSVHTFGEANVQIDPLQRFLNILTESQSALTYVLFIIISLLITAALVFYRYKKSKIDREDKFYTITELINEDTLMLITVFLFIVTTIVTFILLISGVNGLNPEEFNIKVGLFSLVTILILTFCLIWRYIRQRWIIIIGVGIIFISLIGLIIFPNNRIVAASVPILFIALLATVYKLFRSFKLKNLWKSIRLVSAHLIHLSVILLLIGYVGSNFQVTEKNISLSLGSDSEKIDDYILSATDFGRIEGINFVEIDVDYTYYIYWTEYVDINVIKDNNIIGSDKPLMIISTSLITNESKLLRSEIKVISTLLDDIYLTYQNANMNSEGEIDSVEINVKIIPLMKVVWGGIGLMTIGMILRVITEKKSPREKDIRKGKGKDIKNEKFYEELLKRELNNIK